MSLETSLEIDDQLSELDLDQRTRMACLLVAKSVAQGQMIFGRGAVDARNLIAVAYFIETGIMAEELLINSTETVGESVTTKSIPPKEAIQSKGAKS